MGPFSASAIPGTVRQVSIAWTASGGCAPYNGTITGSYPKAVGTQVWTHAISTLTGGYTDTVPQNCNQPGNAATVTYTLTLSDSVGHRVGASQVLQKFIVCP
jgi:hypothetical protein